MLVLYLSIVHLYYVDKTECVCMYLCYATVTKWLKIGMILPWAPGAAAGHVTLVMKDKKGPRGHWLNYLLKEAALLQSKQLGAHRLELKDLFQKRICLCQTVTEM